MTDSTPTTHPAAHAMTAEEYRQQVEQARMEWIGWSKREADNLEARRALLRSPEMHDIMERRKQIRQGKAAAHAKFLAATGGGVQRELTDLDMSPGELSDDNKPDTNAVLKERRRLQIEDAAYRAVKAAGGQLGNLELASMLHVSSHGLPGLLDKSTRLAKRHMTGRVGNEQTGWVVAD